MIWVRSLKDDDLAGRMGLQPKELNKVIAVLSNDCLVKMWVLTHNSKGYLMGMGTETSYRIVTARTNSRKVLSGLLGNSTTTLTMSTSATLSSGESRRCGTSSIPPYVT